MAIFMTKLREMHGNDPLAFEVCVRHVASIIEDRCPAEGKRARGRISLLDA